jgi:drug/metabolite transporter (DMT)-like permease
MMNYTSSQFGYLLLASLFDFCGLCCQVIATQADKVGFVALIGYSVVFYAFLADAFILKETIAGMQLIGSLIIAGTTIGTAAYKLYMEGKEEELRNELE